MAKFVKVHQDSPEDHEYIFYCPGCKCYHWIKTTGNSPKWTFNGDLDNPTVSPSIDCNRSHPESRCHSFVENGKIRFLTDSYHELKGQTVELLDADY